MTLTILHFAKLGYVTSDINSSVWYVMVLPWPGLFNKSSYKTTLRLGVFGESSTEKNS